MKKALKLSIAALPAVIFGITIALMLANIGGSYPMVDCHHSLTCSIEVRQYRESELVLCLVAFIAAVVMFGLVKEEA